MAKVNEGDSSRAEKNIRDGILMTEHNASATPCPTRKVIVAETPQKRGDQNHYGGPSQSNDEGRNAPATRGIFPTKNQWVNQKLHVELVQSKGERPEASPATRRVSLTRVVPRSVDLPVDLDTEKFRSECSLTNNPGHNASAASTIQQGDEQSELQNAKQ